METGNTLFETVPTAPVLGDTHTTGILPAQELLRFIHVTKEITALETILDDQIQPASIDLRLGPKAFRVRASFLPGSNATVQDKLREFAMHEMDITNGGVLEKGCVYIVQLLEHLTLKHRMSALANPKSSTGQTRHFYTCNYEQWSGI